MTLFRVYKLPKIFHFSTLKGYFLRLSWNLSAHPVNSMVVGYTCKKKMAFTILFTRKLSYLVRIFIDFLSQPRGLLMAPINQHHEWRLHRQAGTCFFVCVFMFVYDVEKVWHMKRCTVKTVSSSSESAFTMVGKKEKNDITIKKNTH